MRKFERKSVRFRLYSLFTILTLATMLFVSCAGGTSSADGDVGYLTFGSSRAAKRLSTMSVQLTDLKDLELKGTRNGKTTTLGTWETYAEIPGASIPVQAGNWTFELSANAHYTDPFTLDYLFISDASAVITAGEDTEVTFTMYFAGHPASQSLASGNIILSNGYAISPSYYYPELGAKYPPEAVTLVTSGAVYGINLTYYTNQSYLDAIAMEHDGYVVPAVALASELAITELNGSYRYAMIKEAFEALGYTYPSDDSNAVFWTTGNSGTVSGITSHRVYTFTGTSSINRADNMPGVYALYFKQFN